MVKIVRKKRGVENKKKRSLKDSVLKRIGFGDKDLKSREDIERTLNDLGEGQDSVDIDELKYPEIYDMAGIKYIREDVAKGNPQEYKGMFPIGAKSTSKSVWWKPWTYGWVKSLLGNNDDDKIIKGNMLLLMDNDNNLSLLKNIQPGIYKAKEINSEGEEITHPIILKPNKLRTFVDIDGNVQKMWVADINNSVALPDEPIYSGKAVGEAIAEASISRRDFESEGYTEPWYKRYMWIVPAVLIVLYFAWYFGLLDSLIASFKGGSGGAVADAGQKVAEEVTKNVTGGSVSGS